MFLVLDDGFVGSEAIDIRVDGQDGTYVALLAPGQGGAKTKPLVWIMLGWGRSILCSGIGLDCVGMLVGWSEKELVFEELSMAGLCCAKLRYGNHDSVGGFLGSCI